MRAIVEWPRAAPACIALFKDYQAHSNSSREDYNRGLEHALSRGRRLDERFVALVPTPAWCEGERVPLHNAPIKSSNQPLMDWAINRLAKWV